jgi:hypothetical protein
MDSTILILGVVAFFIFLIVHAIVFWCIHAEGAVTWVVNVLFIVLVVLVLLGLSIYPHSLEIVVGASFIYVLFAILYIFCIFGVVEASITLRLLSEIFRGGSSGVTKKNIFARYNKEKILDRRIERFLWSRELIRVGNMYVQNDRLSFFLLREYFLRSLKWIFPLK